MLPGWLGWLVPDDVEPEARSEVTRLTLALTAAVVICALYLVQQLVSGSGLGAVAYGIGVGLNLGALAFARTATTVQRANVLGHVVLAANLLLVFALTPVTGGPETWNRYYLSVFPLHAFLQLGVRAGVFWTAVMVAACLGLSASPVAVPLEVHPWILASQPVGATIFVALVAGIGEGVLRMRIGQVEAARKAAEDVRDVRGRLVEDAARTLRVPLSDMLERTSALAERLPQSGTRHRVEIIERCGRDLSALLDDLSDTLALRGGTMSLDMEPVDALDLAEQVVELFDARAAGQGLTLTVLGEPGPVRADARRMRQVLSNLVGNALKFTEQGGVTLRVERTVGRVAFVVEDTGIGLEDPERLLRPFEQGAGARERGGTGLGLWISRQLLVGMGGGLDLSSTPGQGTVAVAWLEGP